MTQRNGVITCPICCLSIVRDGLLYRCPVGISPGSPENPCPRTFNAQRGRRVPACPNCGRTAQEEICPKCETTLPARYSETQSRFIVLVGPTGSGKSTYISVLANELKNDVGEGLDVSFVAADDDTNRRYEERISRLYKEHSMVPGTQSARHETKDARPFTFLFSRTRRGPVATMIRRRRSDTSLVFLDSAGEDVNSAEQEARYLSKYFEHAAGIIFFVDPLQVQGARADLINVPPAVPGKPVSAERLLINTTNLLHRARQDKGGVASAIPIAVVVSKIDELGSARLDKSVLGRRPAMADGIDLADRLDVHEFVRAMLTEWNVRLDQYLDQNYKAFNFFGLSALGAPPLNRAVDSGGVRPHRVVDPLLWLLYQFKLIPVARRRTN